MPASQSAVSTSTSTVAGQHSLPSLETSLDSKKRMTTLCIALNSLPSYSWDVLEELENDQPCDISRASSMPDTPGLTWDSAPSSSELPEDKLKSVFEDWEDDDPDTLNATVYLEEDGSQVLLLTPQSAFFYPPPTPPPFGHSPFSKGLFPDNDMALGKRTANVSAQADDSVFPTSQALGHAENNRSGKGRDLFVDTTYPSLNAEWSASVFFPPKLSDEAASWAPYEVGGGPDVPLDCIYSAGDISPVERWDESGHPFYAEDFALLRAFNLLRNGPALTPKDIPKSRRKDDGWHIFSTRTATIFLDETIPCPPAAPSS